MTLIELKIRHSHAASSDVTVCNRNIVDTHYQNLTGLIEPRNEDELQQVAQELQEFIHTTSFKGYDQTVEDVWESTITAYGRCWTFRPESTEGTDDRIYKPGMEGGMFFIADIEQIYYEPSVDAAGLMVFVSQRGSHINDQMRSIFVPPGDLVRPASVVGRLLTFCRTVLCEYSGIVL